MTEALGIEFTTYDEDGQLVAPCIFVDAEEFAALRRVAKAALQWHEAGCPGIADSVAEAQLWSTVTDLPESLRQELTNDA